MACSRVKYNFYHTTELDYASKPQTSWIGHTKEFEARNLTFRETKEIMRYFKAVYIRRVTNTNILLEFKQISCFLLRLLNVAKPSFVYHVGEFPQTCSMSPCNSALFRGNF